MANVAPVITQIRGRGDLDGFQVVWGPMANGDVGIPVGNSIGDTGSALLSGGGGFFAGYADKSVQVEGTFGAAGSVAFEGTNDGNTAHFHGLTDPLGALIAMTAAGIKQVTEHTIWTRPHVTAGDGTTSLTVTVYYRKTNFP